MLSVQASDVTKPFFHHLQVSFPKRTTRDSRNIQSSTTPSDAPQTSPRLLYQDMVSHFPLPNLRLMYQVVSPSVSSPETPKPLNHPQTKTAPPLTPNTPITSTAHDSVLIPAPKPPRHKVLSSRILPHKLHLSGPTYPACTPAKP
ncbi:uncharacterized protein EAF01_011194 [Botrytis porri]|uniref:uncharacterized protein n=1 Tax=Botrytis porri TaxID=87229 RepID=UPI001900971B|nr:uncharacterized protein EAF01_011194 [Botrytis porri]KAF7886516.1 hypothetical protein EAF01_011194 [Botrytis porri]